VSLTLIILTKNEEVHIARAINSAAQIADRVFVIDSGSNDATVQIAEASGAKVLSNPFITQAQQLNWALGQIPPETDWVFRLDADEIITTELAAEILERLSALGSDVAGVCISRRMNFLGAPVKWGGLFPTRFVRLFRYGRGRSEDRWMDEHIIVDGAVVDFKGEIVDDNLNSLTWWTEKHNAYASREALEMLNLEFCFICRESFPSGQSSRQADLKRWLKEKLYSRLPSSFRAAAYFFYRYIIRLGILDGHKGAVFHFLQGFWYRYLVDAKINEVKDYMRANDLEVRLAIKHRLGIDLVESAKPREEGLPL